MIQNSIELSVEEELNKPAQSAATFINSKEELHTTSTDSSSNRTSKSVRFNDERQIFTIPSRSCTISSIKHRCHQNVFQNINSSESASSHSFKKHKFYKRVIVYMIPCRNELLPFFSDLWYKEDEIKEFERRALQLLRSYISSRYGTS